MRQEAHDASWREYLGEPGHPHQNLVPYWFLAGLRLILTVLPQTGYIHPDEYFQSVEIINGDVFDVASNRPWEFNVSRPIRSVSTPYAIVGLPMIILKNAAPFLNLWFNIKPINPYTLILLPRLVCCALSFITDYCMYKICFIYGQNYRARLITLASSYVLLIYATHTFTNSVEMALASLLVYFVAEAMARSDQIIFQSAYLKTCYNNSDNMKDRIRYHRMRLALPWHTFCNVFQISTVSVLGVFNRPTFFAFGFPPIFLWLQRGMGTGSIGISDFNMRAIALVLCSLPALVVLILIDSVYYGTLTIDELLRRDFSPLRDLVLTPYNFIMYNSASQNLAQHGIHPRTTHFLVNVPLLYNVLGLAGLYGFLHLLYRGFTAQYSSLPRVQSIIGLMTTSFIVPIALLSFFPHQEPRFLIPVTLPLVFLHAQRIRPLVVKKYSSNGYNVYVKKKSDLESKDLLLAIWYVINIALTLFYGFIHQAGVYPLVNHLSSEMETKSRLTNIHLVTSHMYPLPISLLHLRYGKSKQFVTAKGSRYERSRDFFSHELGSKGMDEVAQRLQHILNECEHQWADKRLRCRLYYAGPSSLMGDFLAAAVKLNLTATIQRVFYPHLSIEALPSFNSISSPSEENRFKRLISVAHQFGLTLYKVTRGQDPTPSQPQHSPPQQKIVSESRPKFHFNEKECLSVSSFMLKHSRSPVCTSA